MPDFPCSAWARRLNPRAFLTPFVIREMPSPRPRRLRSPPQRADADCGGGGRGRRRARDPYDSVLRVGSHALTLSRSRLGAGRPTPDWQAVWSRGSHDPPRQFSGAAQRPGVPSDLV